MIKFIIMSMSMITNMVFMQMKHPLAMGFMLLFQTFLICLISGNLSKTFWFSYILFLIFLGGMLVLFIYVTSLASNEMFSFSTKMLIISLIIMFMLIFMMTMINLNMNNMMLINNEMNMLNFLESYNYENSISLNKLYNFPTNLITLLLINYLFLTLIATVKITNIFYGPLRPKYF